MCNGQPANASVWCDSPVCCHSSCHRDCSPWPVRRDLQCGRIKFRAVGLRLPCRFVGLEKPLEEVGGWSFGFRFPVRIAIHAKDTLRSRPRHDLRREVRLGGCRFRPSRTIGPNERSRREFDRQPRLLVQTILCRVWQLSVRRVPVRPRSDQTRRATADLLAVGGCDFDRRVRWDTNYASVSDRNLNRSWGLSVKSLWQ